MYSEKDVGEHEISPKYKIALELESKVQSASLECINVAIIETFLHLGRRFERSNLWEDCRTKCSKNLA